MLLDDELLSQKRVTFCKASIEVRLKLNGALNFLPNSRSGIYYSKTNYSGSPLEK